MIELVKQNKMRNFSLIFLTVVFVSCNLNEYKITRLVQKQLTYYELPLEIKKYLSNPPDPILDSYNDLVLITPKDSTIFSLETIETLVGPWVAYEKLRDKKKKIYYRINQDVPAPFIVFKNKLYIPDRYNILGIKKNTIEAKYTEYQLK